MTSISDAAAAAAAKQQQAQGNASADYPPHGLSAGVHRTEAAIAAAKASGGTCSPPKSLSPGAKTQGSRWVQSFLVTVFVSAVAAAVGFSGVLTSGAFLSLVGCFFLVGLLLLRRCLHFLEVDEQLRVTGFTDRQMVDGPGVRVVSPLVKSVEKLKAISLGPLDACKLKDELTGQVRVEQGPQLLFRGAYDQELWTGQATILGSVDYLTVLDLETGVKRLVRGPTTFVPGPYEEIVEKREALALKHDQYVVVEDRASGKRWVEQGEKLLHLEPSWQAVGTVQAAISLKSNEFVRFLDKASGTVRVEQGEQGRVIPGPHEVLLDSSGKRSAVDLKIFEYVRVEDKETGKIRVERGEKLVFLGPTEEVCNPGKQKAVEVDGETAVLLRNRRTGQQSLVTERQLFVPAADEEVLEVRKLIKLADYEAVVVRDKDGADHFHFGHEEPRAFFLPPHAEVVEHIWSRGRRRERRDLKITKIDRRPSYMSFEFNCRTQDNVELVLEGTFFWQVVDVQAMARTTGDTTGDICNHARACFIQLVSRVKLAEFMADFESIAQQVHQQDDKFYRDRGVKIHSLEVTRYQCADQSTAMILEQIIQETTNRMNRLQKQESENEVHLFRIKGDVEEEKATGELLEVRQQNVSKEASMRGSAEAERVRAFLGDLEATVPSLEKRMDLWNVLRKGDALDTLSKGNARLYFTPQDVSLSIENHEHEHREQSGRQESEGDHPGSFTRVESGRA